MVVLSHGETPGEATSHYRTRSGRTRMGPPAGVARWRSRERERYGVLSTVLNDAIALLETLFGPPKT
jgi:hypothetical protein